mgnify:CR=1 FL=1
MLCGIDAESRHAITVASPGKLNAFLEVLGKRPDGYHELETVMLRTNLADQLTVRPNGSGTLLLRFSDATPEALRAGVPLDGRNLILKAAAAICDRVHQPFGAEFILHKRIPPQSGLGGGSGNAAAALMIGVGLEASTTLGAPPEAFALAVAVAASASFLSPIGYQTNMMAMAAGGYKFSDFFRVGLIVNIVVGVTTLVMISYLWL